MRHQGGGRGGGGGGRMRGGRPGGHRGRRGDVRAAVLALLAERPMHGYEMLEELSRRTQGLWRPSPGSVYPTLQQLEDEGLVHSEESDGKRVFRLTDGGKAEVERRGEDQPPPWEVGDESGPFVDLRKAGFGLVSAVMQVAQTGSAEEVARATAILTEARKRLYAMLAEDEEPATEPEA